MSGPSLPPLHPKFVDRSGLSDAVSGKISNVPSEIPVKKGMLAGRTVSTGKQVPNDVVASTKQMKALIKSPKEQQPSRIGNFFTIQDLRRVCEDVNVQTQAIVKEVKVAILKVEHGQIDNKEGGVINKKIEQKLHGLEKLFNELTVKKNQGFDSDIDIQEEEVFKEDIDDDIDSIEEDLLEIRDALKVFASTIDEPTKSLTKLQQMNLKKARDRFFL